MLFLKHCMIVGEKPLPYEVASRLPGWEGLVATANMLKAQISKFGLNLHVDDITPGRGNCFFVAVIQQLRRPDIYPTLSRTLQQIADRWDHLTLRKAVCSFAKTSPEVASRREFFLYSTGGVPWDVYWGPDHLMKPTIWVDAASVQVTAWFLGMDLLIVSDSSNSQDPFSRIHSSFDDVPNGSTKEILLGAKTDVHYQSLLPNVSASSPTSQRRDPGKTIHSVKASEATRSGYKTMSSSLGMTPDLAQAPNLGCEKTFPPLSPVKVQSKPPLDSAVKLPNPTDAPPADGDPSGDDEDLLPTQCPACNRDFPQLMRHLRSKACAEKVGEERIAELRELFKKKAVSKYNHSEKGALREAMRNKNNKTNYTATKKKKNLWKAAERTRKRKADDMGTQLAMDMFKID